MKKFKDLMGIEQFKINRKTLKESNPKVTIGIKFEQFCKEIRQSKIKRRRQKVQELNRKYFQAIQANFKTATPLKYEDKIYGAEVSIPFNQLKKVYPLRYVEWINVKEIEGHKKHVLKEGRPLFAIVAKVQIYVEKVKKKKLSSEFRITLIKAKDETKAKRKFRKEFKFYEKPYLNPYGRIVSWRLKKIIDCYETDFFEENGLDIKYGVEVYSKIFRNKNKHIFEAFTK